MKKNHTYKILIAAGGTGGHVFPAIAIADEIKKQNPETMFLFIGTKNKIESRVVPASGYDVKFIWISGLHRSLRLENIIFPIKVLVALLQSFFIIKKYKPNVVIGTGGYVCGPVLFVASILKIKTVIHESNSYPGIATRLLAKKATKVYTAFSATSKYLNNKENVEVVGTPTRECIGKISKIDGLKYFNLTAKNKTILIFGGSLGAASINNAVKNILPELVNNKLQIIWQTGKTSDNYYTLKSKNVWIGEFIDKMDYAYAAADIIVCRSGATTIAEITKIGKAAIFVPYPHAAANHQYYNAKTLSDEKAAILVEDKDVDTKLLKEILYLLKDYKKRTAIGKKCKIIGKPNAGKNIAKNILMMIK